MLVAPGVMHVSGRWTYKVNYRLDGHMERRKGSLFACGFTQRDYEETFYTCCPYPSTTCHHHYHSAIFVTCVSKPYLSVHTWFECFHTVLSEYGVGSVMATCSFASQHVVASSCYSTRMICSRETIPYLISFIKHLRQHFRIKNLGPLRYFHDLEISQDPQILFYHSSTEVHSGPR